MDEKAKVQAGTEEPLLQVRDLSVSFLSRRSAVKAVRGVSFDVARGQIVALVGESGCGKSVTSKSLMGLVKRPGQILDGSSILFEGRELTEFGEREWREFRGRSCSMVFQDALVSLNPTMRVGRQVMEALSNHDKTLTKTQLEARALQMLQAMGIPDAEGCMRRYAHELSGGMRQRVMIAIAMVAEPKLLIADEPTTSLDVTIQAQILDLVREQRDTRGTSVILVTHDLGIVADLADRIVVMYAGRVVEQGATRDIFYAPKHPYTRALLASVPNPDLPCKEPLATIEGAIPDMARPPAGCAFCDRCPHAMVVCAQQDAPVFQLDSGHEASCWLLDDRCPRGGER